MSVKGRSTGKGKVAQSCPSSSVQKTDIATILLQYQQGSSKDYDKFLSELTNPNIEAGLLLQHLRGLQDCVTLLDKQHEIIAGVILHLDWTSKEENVVKVYQSLVLNLVSVHTDYLKSALKMLVKNFCPKLPPELKCLPDHEIDPAVKKKWDAVFVSVQGLLKAIVHTVPMAPRLLMPMLTEIFPYMTRDIYIQECYVKNLLHVTLYIPALRQSILELIVDKMIKLDVCSPREEIKEAEAAAEEMDTDTAIFDMEEPDSKSSEPRIKPMNHTEAHKLDVLMDLVLHYIHNTCYLNDELQWEATKTLYREMLLVFEKILLPTYASCHVQFFMFYLCSLKPAICEGFIDYLWKQVQQPTIQAVYRQAAVAYMGSLLSRAKFISISTVKTCMDLMVRWIHSYLDETSQDFVMADPTHHGPFYSVCQAIFYVFVFRSKEILEMKKGFKWAEGLNFQRIVTSRLNPLKICLPVIVKTFSSLTRQHQLAFCDTIIERNNRSFLPVQTEVGSGGDQKLLDAFFPFDPYLLHRSARFISPHYREYQGSVEEDESSDEEDMFTEEPTTSSSVSDVNVVKLITPGSATADKVFDFMNYSVSPGFKHFLIQVT